MSAKMRVAAMAMAAFVLPGVFLPVGVVLAGKAETANARRVFGRVTDEQGQPVAAALVSAGAHAARQLRDPAMTKTQADTDGRFDMTVEFADVRYTVWVRKNGYNSKTVKVLAGDGKEIGVILESSPRHTLTGTVTDGRTGGPIAGATVVFVPEYDNPSEHKTDNAGRFQIAGLPEYIGQSIIYAKAEGLVSPYQMVRGKDKAVVLSLGAPAGLKGIAYDQLSGAPLPDCVVTARPGFMSGFSIRTMTGKNGQFRFMHLPPGEYTVGASRGDLYEPPTRGQVLERAEIPLDAGETGFFQIAMRSRVAVSGRVLGPDGKAAADTVVGMAVLWGLNPSELWETTRTDEQGQFVLLTGRLGQTEMIEAFSPEHGSGSARVSVGDPAKGEATEKVTIQLSGAMRVRGVVKDPSGGPLEGIRMGTGCITGPDGGFDLGRIPIDAPPGEDQSVAFIHKPAAKPDPQARFFHHKKIAVKAEPGKEIDLSVVLEPAELLTFTGQVLDHTGTPAPRAQLILFAGNADAATWKDDLHPERMAFSSGSVDRDQRNTPLCKTIAGDDGRWTIWVVRETAEELKLGRVVGNADASRYSLGAEDPPGRSVLIPDIVLPDGETRKQIDVKLDAVPTGGTISGRVADDQGKALAGIILQTSFPAQRVTTGPDGRFVITGLADNNVTLWLRSEGWGILSPDPGDRKDMLRLNDLAAAVPPATSEKEARRRAAQRQDAGKNSPAADEPQKEPREILIVLGKNGTISGAVRWESGKPLCGCEVSAPGLPGGNSGADGAFRIPDCPPGRYQLHARTPDGIVGGAQIDLKPGDEARAQIVLPEASHTIKGQVTDTQGGPVVGVKLSLSGSACQKQTLPDEQGRFEFKVPAGTYTLSARPNHDTFARTIGKVEVNVQGEAKEHKVLLVVDPAEVRVRPAWISDEPAGALR